MSDIRDNRDNLYRALSVPLLAIGAIMVRTADDIPGVSPEIGALAAASVGVRGLLQMAFGNGDSPSLLMAKTFLPLVQIGIGISMAVTATSALGYIVAGGLFAWSAVNIYEARQAWKNPCRNLCNNNSVNEGNAAAASNEGPSGATQSNQHTQKWSKAKSTTPASVDMKYTDAMKHAGTMPTPPHTSQSNNTTATTLGEISVSIKL